jgi:hypothetical protein
VLQVGQSQLHFLSIWFSPSCVPFHGRRLQTARHEMAPFHQFFQF